MKNNQKILDYLRNEEVKNINMINFIENYTIDIMEKEGSTVLVRGKSDQNWVYISSSSENELESTLDKHKDEEYFAVVEDWMIPYICKDKVIDWKLSCIKLFFPHDKELYTNKHKITKLELKDAEYIYNNSKYKEYTTLDYIKERIQNGIGLGIFEDEKLVAWIIIHDDGAIGFLNVVETYRNRGYAKSLIVAIVDELRKIDKVPFVHIEESNIKSMNLATKLGFVRDRKVHWMKTKNKF